MKRLREKNIGIRVSEQEYAMIQRKLVVTGLSLRQFMLKCFEEKAIQIKQGGDAVVIELKRIGNNLNQLTYAVNSGQIADCSVGLRQIYEEIREVRGQWQS